MFCEKCGNKIQDGERFCSVCGNRVEQPERQEPAPDLMKGMGYGYKQPQDHQQTPGYDREPVRKTKRRKEEDDFEEEWKEEAKKEQITFIILGVIIVALVVAIVAGVISLVKSSNYQEEKRVPQLTEEQKEELNHSKKVPSADEAAAEETPETAEPTVPVQQPEAAAETAEEPAGRIAPEETPAPTREITPVPTQEITPIPTPEVVVVEKSEDFIIPDSSARYLTNADLSSLTEWEVRVARNEIYARHGRIFKTDDLAEYFKGKNWYIGSVAPEAFDDSYLNAIEIENVKFITNYEKAHNLNQ